MIKAKNLANKHVGLTGIEIYLNETFQFTFFSDHESFRYIILRILKVQKSAKQEIKLLKISQLLVL